MSAVRGQRSREIGIYSMRFGADVRDGEPMSDLERERCPGADEVCVSQSVSVIVRLYIPLPISGLSAVRGPRSRAERSNCAVCGRV